MSMAAMVTIGMSALRRACRTSTRRSLMPFERAVRMYSLLSTSSSEARM